MKQTFKTKSSKVCSFTSHGWKAVHGVKRDFFVSDEEYHVYQMWCGKIADFPVAIEGVSMKRIQEITCKTCRFVMHIL